MKKCITIIVFLILAINCFGQTDTILNYKGKRLYYSNYPLPNTATRYFNGFGGFVSFYDTARLAFSVTTTGSGAATYNSSTGVFNIPTPAASSAWNLTGNASIDSSVNFLGTTDSRVLYLKTKGIRGLTIDTLQRTILGNLSIPTFATDSAQLLLNNRGLSFKRGDGTTMGTRLGVSYATGEFIIAGNNSGFNYMEGATSEFKVTSAGVGTFNSTVNSPKFVSSASSGVVADFFTTGSGNAQVYLPNTNYLGGAAALIGTGSVGPTVAVFKLQLYNQQLGTYPDRWHGFGSGSFSSSATEKPSVILDATSTTRGFLPPVQTTAQRNAGGISTGTLAGGSGYTNGSYVAKTITGGTGVGATATITVSGGAITVFAVIYAGAGYIVGDVLSASGLGGGTGFSWTVTAITSPATGLLVFDSDSASLFQYTGSAWQNIRTTGAGSGTVENIATGLGLSGGPITTTGTLLIDTADVSILSRQRAAATYLMQDGTTPLTANWNMGAFNATYTKTGATANTVYDAFYATNTTTASSGNQMYGGFYHSGGQGWKTTATAASQAVDIRHGAIPIQGTTNPTAAWVLEHSINGGAYTRNLAVRNNGMIGFGSSVTLTADAFYSTITANSDFSSEVVVSSAITQATVKSFITGVLYLSGAGAFTAARGVSATVQNDGSSVSNILRGGAFSVKNNNAGSRANTLIGVEASAVSDASSGGTIALMTALDASFYVNAAGPTVTDAYGVRVKDILVNSGTFTRTYGVWVGDITLGTQTNTPYSFYASDVNALNYFGGNTGIGAVPVTDKLEVTGNISLMTAGNKLKITTGTNGSAGNATLVGGTVTVSCNIVTANSLIMLTRKTSGGTIGTAITYTLSAGTSFTINSDNPLDTSTFTYLIIN